jgi:hypothetical protein
MGRESRSVSDVWQREASVLAIPPCWIMRWSSKHTCANPSITRTVSELRGGEWGLENEAGEGGSTPLRLYA